MAASSDLSLSAAIDASDVEYAEELTSLLGRLRNDDGRRSRQSILSDLGWMPYQEEGSNATFTPEQVKQMVIDRFLTPQWSIDEEHLGLYQM